MEMSPQLARLVAWLEKMHARVMQAEQAARDVVDDTPAYTARMQEKARLLASLEEEGETYLEGLPEPLQDQAGHRLHRISASARNALRIGSIFYMSALLYPEDHKPGQPDDLQVFIRRLRDEGEHYTLHPQDSRTVVSGGRRALANAGKGSFPLSPSSPNALWPAG